MISHFRIVIWSEPPRSFWDESISDIQSDKKVNIRNNFKLNKFKDKRNEVWLVPLGLGWGWGVGLIIGILRCGIVEGASAPTWTQALVWVPSLPCCETSGESFVLSELHFTNLPNGDNNTYFLRYLYILTEHKHRAMHRYLRNISSPSLPLFFQRPFPSK